jgi:hypothetical protein
VEDQPSIVLCCCCDISLPKLTVAHIPVVEDCDAGLQKPAVARAARGAERIGTVPSALCSVCYP